MSKTIYNSPVLLHLHIVLFGERVDCKCKILVYGNQNTKIYWNKNLNCHEFSPAKTIVSPGSAQLKKVFWQIYSNNKQFNWIKVDLCA